MNSFSFSHFFISLLLVFAVSWLFIRGNSPFSFSPTSTSSLSPDANVRSRRLEAKKSAVTPSKNGSENANFDLLTAKQEVSKVLSLIYHRYEFNDTYGPNFTFTSSNMDRTTWDMLKYKLAYKTLEGNQDYLMIFGGSSVTAGHDNFFNQSYPMTFQRRMKKVFELLGINLTVRDIAQGANNCIPYLHCTESMGGKNPDFVNWEQV